MTMKVLLGILGVLVILVLAWIVSYRLDIWRRNNSFDVQVLINGTNINVETVKKAQEIQIGLTKYKNIKENQGMLFVFDPPSKPAFWMKDVSFPIDIIWIKEGKVVGLEENLAPCKTNSCPTYSCELEIDYVLEVNAGIVEKKNIKIGNSFSYYEE